MLRKVIAEEFETKNTGFVFRGHEVKRIEAFSDAVFGFAVTLLIVSLEVPKSFEELMVTMRGFFAFGISFLFLMLIWYDQNVFFRRYGMDDVTTIFLNCVLIFLVLFYVYPLKFLFTLIFSNQIYGAGHSPFIIEQNDISRLMMVYGMGYIFIYVLFFFMYIHALRKRSSLQLTALEIFDTKTQMYRYIILIIIGILSVLASQVLPNAKAGNAGLVYILIGPAFSIYYSYRGRRRRSLVITSASSQQRNK